MSGRASRGRIPRPFDVESLAVALGVDVADTAGLSKALGIGRRWVRRYRLTGLSAHQADRWAIGVGLHPGEVWPSWWACGVSRGSGALAAEQPSEATDATTGQAGER